MKKLTQYSRLSLAISTITASLASPGLIADESFALEEIVVTAQKRAESMQDIPVAVSAIGSGDIENLGWDNPADVAAQVPNMQVSAPYGEVQPLFAIRGVSMVDYTPSQASPIGVYADEAYIGATYLHGLSMFDMERIEVLRGPQGTLYGKNTTGGAINLISRTPDIDTDTNGYLTAGAGNYGLGSFNGAIEGTLIDDVLAGRLAINYKKNDGVWENNAGPDMAQTDYRSARLTLNYQPTEELNAVLKITSGKSTPRNTSPRAEGTTATGTNYAGSTEVLDNDYHEGSVDKVGKSEAEMTSVNLKVSYNFDNYSLISVSSFYDGDYNNQSDTDGTSDSLIAINWASDTEAFAQDLRLVSNYDGPFNFIAGAYYGHEDINTDILHESFYGTALDPTVAPALQQALANGVFGQITRRQDVIKESMAVYSHFTYDISDDLGLTVGLRYTEDEITMNHLNYSRINGAPFAGLLNAAPFLGISDPSTSGTWIGGAGNFVGVDAPLVPTAVLGAGHPSGAPAGTPSDMVFTHGPYTTASAPKRSESEEEFTGTISLDYQVNEELMTYASYSKGFRAGSYNSGLVYLDEGDSAYASPEYVDAFELGFKGEFFDNRLRLNGALFYYDYTDQQFVNQIGISAILENAGGADIYGLELEMLAMPAEGLTVQAGLGLIDAEYSELELTGSDLKGNEPVSSPELNFNVAVDYEMDIGADYTARLHLDGNFVDDQWFSAYNDAPGYEDISQDAYWIWNARTTFTDSEEKYALSLWVANLADEEYDVYSINLASGFGFNLFTEGAPRTYGVDFTVRF